MSTLIVRPPWAGQPGWTGAWVDRAPPPGASVPMVWAHPREIPACAELLVAVPAALLSWHTVTLPKLPPSRWRAALEGLLEDRLLTDASRVHLALQPGARAGATMQVAACDRDWLVQCLQGLEAAGREVARIVPEFSPGDPALHLLGQPERGWLVERTPQQVHCLPVAHPAREALRAWQALRGTGPASVQADPAFAALAEEVWGGPPTLLPVDAVLRQAAQSVWDLAQFDLSSGRSRHKRLARAWHRGWTDPAWRPLRWGLALLLLINVAGLQARAWQESRRLDVLRGQIEAVLTGTFPQVGAVIDPLRQMERETLALAQAAGQAQAGDLTRMLAPLAGLAAPAPGGLDYRPGELVLTGWQVPPGAVDELKGRLPQGYRLELRGQQWRLHLQAAEGAP